MPTKLTLFDANRAVVDAYEYAFVDLLDDDDQEALEVRCCRFDALKGGPDACLVSPANSFGFMDGGIDQAYLNYFGVELQHKVQREIRQRFRGGELLVGQAYSVETDCVYWPTLIVAPTMRVPGPIADPIWIFQAARAAMMVSTGHLFMPGMGTGVGGIYPEIAARLVRAAYDWSMGGRVEFKSWQEALRWQRVAVQGEEFVAAWEANQAGAQQPGIHHHGEGSLSVASRPGEMHSHGAEHAAHSH